MLFNSLEYACLLIASLMFVWLFLSRHKTRVILLIAAGYIFYATWNTAYLPLIFISSSLDYALSRLMTRTEEAFKRKALLSVSLIVNLGILCTFKYFNFFAGEVSAVLGLAGIEIAPPKFSLFLSVGISFYTFQTLSYTIDVYRKKIDPAKSYLDYLLFVSFFPKLLSGPISRGSALLPQIEHPPRLTAEQGSIAIYRIGIGLVKKIAIADFLGAHLVNQVFSNPQMYSSLETLLGVYGYSFQIYMDFSAYSDIAIGSAALLGFKLEENFNLPYKASDLRDFWRRWHISLSTWLRDYLYISLGGSKRSEPRVYLNLMITMILGGLWHGAAATFVIWGTLHGAALVVTRFAQKRFKRLNANRPLFRALCIFLTFNFVSAAWVFFRAASFDSAIDVFASISELSFDALNLHAPALAALCIAAVGHFLPISLFEKSKDLFQRAPAWVQAACLILAILAVQQIAQTEIEPFIYSQF